MSLFVSNHHKICNFRELIVHPSAIQGMLPATEMGVPSASDKASRFPFSAVGSAVLVVATGLGLVACGGGGGGGSSPGSPATVSLSGQAIKGPVIDGQVCAYTLNSPRQQIACAKTDSSANYQLQLPAGTGDVLLEVTGGSYIDEATGQKVALTSPLRTLTKAGGPIENVLMTPFTELAVQRATAGNPGGNLTLVGFQTQIGALETGLGITGLATGKPFGGKSAADITHQKALEAFAKQQNAMGKTVGEALNVMGLTLDKCGVTSVGATLAVYSQASKSSTLETAKAVLAQPSVGTVGNADIYIDGFSVQISQNLPAPCTDSFVVDGVAQPYADLFNAGATGSSTTAKTVAITACGATAGMKAVFPQANISILGVLATGGVIRIWDGKAAADPSALIGISVGAIAITGVPSAPNSTSVGALSISGVGAGTANAGIILTGGKLPANALPSLIGATSSGQASLSIPGGFAFQMTGADPIDLTASGLLLNEGCLLPATANKSFGDIAVAKANTSNVSVNQQSSRAILNWSTFNIGAEASVSFNQPSASAVVLNQVTTSSPSLILGKLSSNGQVWVQSPTTLDSSGGSVVISGGGLTTSGTSSSVGGGITVSSK